MMEGDVVNDGMRACSCGSLNHSLNHCCDDDYEDDNLLGFFLVKAYVGIPEAKHINSFIHSFIPCHILCQVKTKHITKQQFS